MTEAVTLSVCTHKSYTALLVLTYKAGSINPLCQKYTWVWWQCWMIMNKMNNRF